MPRPDLAVSPDANAESLKQINEAAAAQKL